MQRGGSLQEHLLLYSERYENYSDFRAEIGTIAKAQSDKLLTPQPMDISALGGKAREQQRGGMNLQPARFNGNCNTCGKPGHKAADCWQGQGSKKAGSKGGGRGQSRQSSRQGRWMMGEQQQEPPRDRALSVA